MYNELCKILDPGKPSFTPKKGKPSVVMFVGLQGALIYFFYFRCTFCNKLICELALTI